MMLLGGEKYIQSEKGSYITSSAMLGKKNDSPIIPINNIIVANHQAHLFLFLMRKIVTIKQVKMQSNTISIIEKILLSK